MNLDTLPIELRHAIMTYLPLKDIQATISSSRRLRSFNDQFWKDIVQAHVGLQVNSSLIAKDLYIKCYPLIQSGLSGDWYVKYINEIDDLYYNLGGSGIFQTKKDFAVAHVYFWRYMDLFNQVYVERTYFYDENGRNDHGIYPLHHVITSLAKTIKNHIPDPWTDEITSAFRVYQKFVSSFVNKFMDVLELENEVNEILFISGSSAYEFKAYLLCMPYVDFYEYLYRPCPTENLTQKLFSDQDRFIYNSEEREHFYLKMSGELTIQAVDDILLYMAPNPYETDSESVLD